MHTEDNCSVGEVVLYHLDSAKAYMDTVGLLSHRLALLGTYISERNWDKADSSLIKLPLNTVNDTAIYDLYQMNIELGRDSLNLLQISSTDSTRLRQIAADSTLNAAVLAKGMLGIILDTMYLPNPEPYTPPSARMAEEEQTEDAVTELNFRDVWLKNLPAEHTVWQALETELTKLKDQAVRDPLMQNHSMQNSNYSELI